MLITSTLPGYPLLSWYVIGQICTGGFSLGPQIITRDDGPYQMMRDLDDKATKVGGENVIQEAMTFSCIFESDIVSFLYNLFHQGTMLQNNEVGEFLIMFHLKPLIWFSWGFLKNRRNGG